MGLPAFKLPEEFAFVSAEDYLDFECKAETRDWAAVLDLSSIACQVPLAEVYAGIGLPAAAE